MVDEIESSTDSFSSTSKKSSLRESQSVYTSLLRSSGEMGSRSMNRKQIFILIILGFGHFFIAASDALQAPFFPDKCFIKGVSFLACGLIFGTFALTEKIRKLLHPCRSKMFVYIAPHTTLRFGLFLAGTTTVLFGVLDKVSTSHEFAIMALFLRIVQAVGVAFSVLSVDILNLQEYDMRWNIVDPTLVTTSAYHFGSIFGSLIGGTLYMAGGYPMPFVVFGSLILLAGLLIIVVLPAPDNYTLMGHEFDGYYGDSVRFTDSLVIAVFIALTGFNDVTLAHHLSQFNLSPIGIGSIFMIFRLLQFFFNYLWIRLRDNGFNVVDNFILDYYWNGLSSGDYFRDTDGYYKWFNALPTIAIFVGPVAGGYLIDTIGYRSATEVALALESFTLLLLIVWKIFKF